MTGSSALTNRSTSTATAWSSSSPRRDRFSPDGAERGAELAAAAKQLPFDRSLTVTSDVRDLGVAQSRGVQADDPPLPGAHCGRSDDIKGGEQLDPELWASPLVGGFRDAVIVIAGAKRDGAAGAWV